MPKSAKESTKKRARECQGRNESARESEKGPESARLGQRVPEDSKEARESQGSRANMPQEWTLKFDRPQVSTLKIREGETTRGGNNSITFDWNTIVAKGPHNSIILWGHMPDSSI